MDNDHLRVFARFSLLMHMVEKGGFDGVFAEAQAFQAFASGEQGAFERLASDGIDAAVRKNANLTPLMAACGLGRPDLAVRLLEAGASVLAADCEGWTPLVFALLARCPDCLGLLLSSGADVEARERSSLMTPLMLAVAQCDAQIVKALLAAGCRVDALDGLGRSALFHAACASPDAPAMARLLVEAGASMDSPAASGKTALMKAASLGRSEVVSALAKAGADVEAADASGATSLMLAADAGSSDSVRELVLAGARVDAVDKSGAGALHRAAAAGSCEACSFLIGSGADPLALDRRGESPEDMALALGRLECAQLLAAWRERSALDSAVDDSSCKSSKGLPRV